MLDAATTAHPAAAADGAVIRQPELVAEVPWRRAFFRVVLAVAPIRFTPDPFLGRPCRFLPPLVAAFRVDWGRCGRGSFPWPFVARETQEVAETVRRVQIRQLPDLASAWATAPVARAGVCRMAARPLAATPFGAEA